MVSAIDPDPIRRPGTRLIHALAPGDVTMPFTMADGRVAFAVANPARPPYILHTDGSTERLCPITKGYEFLEKGQ